MGILRLPKELFHHICFQCDPPEIRVLRTVNKLLLAIANEYFLPEIKLFFLKEDFDTAVRLVQTSEIARGVRRLTLHADVFPQDVEYEEWDDQRIDQAMQVECQIPKVVEAKLAINELDRQVQHGSASQERSIRMQIEDLSMTMYAAQRQASNEGLQDAYDSFAALHARQPDCMAEMPHKISSILEACSHLYSVLLAPPVQSAPVSAWPTCFRKAMVRPWLKQQGLIAGYLFAAVLSSSVLTQRSLPQFVVNCLPYQNFKACNMASRSMFSMLGSLRSIAISVVQIDDINVDKAVHEDPKTDEIAGRLSGFLTMAPKLQKLRVCAFPRLQLHGIVGTYNWPYLATVCLGNFSCTLDGLVGFLRRHSGTLRYLRLNSPFIENRFEWEECFRSVAGNLHKLERVCLRGVFQAYLPQYSALYFSYKGHAEDDFTKKVQNFILKGGDDMPESYDELIPLMSNHPSYWNSETNTAIIPPFVLAQFGRMENARDVRETLYKQRLAGFRYRHALGDGLAALC